MPVVFPETETSPLSLRVAGVAPEFRTIAGPALPKKFNPPPPTVTVPPAAMTFLPPCRRRIFGVELEVDSKVVVPPASVTLMFPRMLPCICWTPLKMIEPPPCSTDDGVKTNGVQQMQIGRAHV